jgi:hypothetical protein
MESWAQQYWGLNMRQHKKIAENVNHWSILIRNSIYHLHTYSSEDVKLPWFIIQHISR